MKNARLNTMYIPDIALLHAIVCNDPLNGLIPFEKSGLLNSCFFEFLSWNRMLPLFFHRVKQQNLENQFDDITLQKLNEYYQKNTFQYLQRKSVLIEILTLLNAEGIVPIVLKGTALSETVYENPALRPMMDIDLLLNEADIAKAVTVIKACGAKELYTFESKFTSGLLEHIPPLVYKGIMFELHNHIIARYDKGYLPPETVMNCTTDLTIGTGQAQILSPTLQLYHLILHAHKHFESGYLRFIWLCDMYFHLKKNYTEIDKKQWEVLTHNPTLETLVENISQWLYYSFQITLPSNAGENINDAEFLKYCRKYIPNEHQIGTPKMIKKLPGISLKLKFIIGKLFPGWSYIKLKYKLSSNNFVVFYYPVLYLNYLKKVWKLWIK